MPDLNTLIPRASLMTIDKFKDLVRDWDQDFNTKEGDAFARGVMQRNKIDMQMRIAEENGLGEIYHNAFYSLFKRSFEKVDRMVVKMLEHNKQLATTDWKYRPGR